MDNTNQRRRAQTFANSKLNQSGVFPTIQSEIFSDQMKCRMRLFLPLETFSLEASEEVNEENMKPHHDITPEKHNVKSFSWIESKVFLHSLINFSQSNFINELNLSNYKKKYCTQYTPAGEKQGRDGKKLFEAIEKMITRLNVSTCVNDSNFFRPGSQFSVWIVE